MTEREVYEPEALVARLTVGTRVRVRISPEAVLGCGCRAPEYMLGPQPTGRIITVFEKPPPSQCQICFDRAPEPGYRFRVEAENGQGIAVFPAIALTPIEEEPHG